MDELSKVASRRWHGWDEQRLVDGRVVERCDFTVSGDAVEAREAFVAHGCDRPKPQVKKRRPGGFAIR